MGARRLLSLLVPIRPSLWVPSSVSTPRSIHTGSQPNAVAVAAVSNKHDDLEDVPVASPPPPPPPPRKQRRTPRLSQGSWNAPPLNLAHSLRTGTLVPTVTPDVIAAASLAGRRSTNEDRYHMKQLTDDLLLICMFDGHGGACAANYAWQHMADIVAGMLEEGKDCEEVLLNAFIALNDGFTRLVQQQPAGMSSGVGTTATVCLLRDSRHLYVAHVGDTSAVLCRDGAPLRLTTHHCAEDVCERRRIEEAGGVLLRRGDGAERVNGRLDMTRSIGDVDLKPFGVTAVPSTVSIKVKHGHDAFLVLATDGVTEVLDDVEMLHAISDCVDPERAAKQLTEQALNYGSQDNLTAVIVPFGAWGRHVRETGSPANVPFSIGRNIFGPRYN